jgi:4-carboxymuconolactone decarboxylase
MATPLRSKDPHRVDLMTPPEGVAVTLPDIDAEMVALVQLAAVVAGGSEAQLREQLLVAVEQVRAVWVEELLLQSYLFAGFPRALNATREWRRISGVAAPQHDGEAIDGRQERLERGERTCATVYGAFYERLRVNVRELHPALDQWMIEEGYGKVLSREALDLARRELCIVAACAMAGQDRQLHSHLHGALHAGASAAAVTSTLKAIAPWLGANDRTRYEGLWARVQGK